MDLFPQAYTGSQAKSRRGARAVLRPGSEALLGARAQRTNLIPAGPNVVCAVLITLSGCAFVTCATPSVVNWTKRSLMSQVHEGCTHAISTACPFVAVSMTCSIARSVAITGSVG